MARAPVWLGKDIGTAETDEGCTKLQSTQGIDWDAYASTYDFMAIVNPAYHENIELLRTTLPELALPEDAAICDVGAGTGNYICALAQDLPEARYVHLDFDKAMNDVAERKYASAGVKHVELRCCDAQGATFPESSFDLVVCVNALYTMQDRRNLLRKFREWLKPSGRLFIIDYGRQVNLRDWTWYLISHVVKTQGVWPAVKLLKKNSENIRQNRRGSRAQAQGDYWLHTTEEFGEILSGCGYVVETLASCYRGYSDLAVCSPDKS